ncbi:edem3, partial [Symbiodinium sp. KB8]
MLVTDSPLCEGTELPEAEGKLLVSERGTCTFVEKAVTAQRLGATGLVVANTEPGLLRMPMGNITEGLNVTIPLVMIRDIQFPLLTNTEVPLLAAFKPTKADCIANYSVSAEGRGVEVDTQGHTAFTPSELKRWPQPFTVEGGNVEIVTPELLAPELAGRLKDEPFEFMAASFSGALPYVDVELLVAEPLDACEPLRNHGVEGKFIIARRGTCPMIEKARFAQQIGALGLVILNSPGVVGVAQAVGDGDESSIVHIPTIMVSSSFGEAIGIQGDATDEEAKDQFQNGIKIRLHGTRVNPETWELIQQMISLPEGRWLPGDHYRRKVYLRNLVRLNHPESPQEQFERLKGTAHQDAVDEFEVAVERVLTNLKAGGVDFDARQEWLDSLKDPSNVFGGSPVTSFLSRPLPFDWLDLSNPMF